VLLSMVGSCDRVCHGSVAIMMRDALISSHIRFSVRLTKCTAIALVEVTLVPSYVGVMVRQACVEIVIHDTTISSSVDVVGLVRKSSTMITTKDSLTGSGVSVHTIAPIGVAVIIAGETWASVHVGIAEMVAALDISITVDSVLVCIIIIAIAAVTREEAHSCR
jgi:hypothetical protein